MTKRMTLAALLAVATLGLNANRHFLRGHQQLC